MKSRFPQPPATAATIEDVYEWVLTTKRDPIEHLPTIRALAAQTPVVVSLVKRREWDVAVLAGHQMSPFPVAGEVAVSAAGEGLSPRRYVSHNIETDPLQDLLQRLASYQLDHLDSLAAEPIDCDMLLIDTVHTADRLRQEFARWVPHVSRWIVLRGTATFGEIGEKKQGPGLLVAARELMASDPRWNRVSTIPADVSGHPRP